MIYMVDFKPRTVLAIQWTGDNLEDIKKFTGEGYDCHSSDNLNILTRDGRENITVLKNDFIINYNGYILALQPDDFYGLFTDHYKDYEEMWFIEETPTDVKRAEENNYEMNLPNT